MRTHYVLEWQWENGNWEAIGNPHATLEEAKTAARRSMLRRDHWRIVKVETAFTVVLEANAELQPK